MAIIFMENFEWATLSSAGVGSLAIRTDEITATSGLTGYIDTGINGMYGKCLVITSTTTQLTRRLGWSLPTNYSTGLFSFAMSFTSGSHANAFTFFGINTGATNQIGIRLNVDGTISAMRNTTALGTSTLTLQTGTRYRVEIGFVISASVGEVVVKVNGVTFLNLSAVNTANSGTTFNRFIFGALSVGTVYYDDIAFETDKTAFRDDFRIETLYPTGDISKQSTPSTGSTAWAVIDETPVSTVDYTTFSGVQKDVYSLSDLSSNSTIYGVGIFSIGNKTDTNPASGQFVFNTPTVSTTGEVFAFNSASGLYSTYYSGSYTASDLNLSTIEVSKTV